MNDNHWGSLSQGDLPRFYFTSSYEEAVEELSYVYGQYIYEVIVELDDEFQVPYSQSTWTGDYDSHDEWGCRVSPSRFGKDEDSLWIHCNISVFKTSPRLVADNCCLGRVAA